MGEPRATRLDRAPGRKSGGSPDLDACSLVPGLPSANGTSDLPANDHLQADGSIRAKKTVGGWASRCYQRGPDGWVAGNPAALP